MLRHTFGGKRHKAKQEVVCQTCHFKRDVGRWLRSRASPIHDENIETIDLHFWLTSRWVDYPGYITGYPGNMGTGLYDLDKMMLAGLDIAEIVPRISD